MGKKVLLETLGQMAVIAFAWYLSEPRPAVAPSFWYRVERVSRNVNQYSMERYRDSIGEYL